MSFRRAHVAPALCFFLSALTGACSRSEANRIERLALLPFENLSADPQLDWISQAIPGTLSIQLAPAPDLNATAVTAPRDVVSVRATRALFGYYTNHNGRLRLNAQLRDVARQKTLQTIAAEGEVRAGVLPLIDRIARELHSGVQPSPHRNEAAVRDYWMSVAAEDPARRVELLERSLAADPGFAPAHLALIPSRLAARDTAGVAAAIAQARRHSAAFTPLERARLDLLEARTRNDSAAMLRALTALTRLTPASAEIWRSLGELELARRNLSAAALALDRSLDSDPYNVNALNLLAYTRAYAGDLEGARRVLARYTEVAPGDANVQDTSGDVHFHLGQFAEAEKYYLEAHRINPGLLAGGDLYRAALAASFAGDLRRADSHFANWLAIRKQGGDPLLSLREAVWEASTGRLAQARTRLRQLVQVPGTSPEVRNATAAQLALLDKAAGDRATAPVAPGNASAAVAGFLTQPGTTSAGWTERAQSLPPAVRGTLLGYALVLNGHFKEAVPVWRAVYQASHPAAESDARVMLAWALSASSQSADAKPLLARAPIPGRAAEPGLTFLTWLKYRDLAAR